MPDRLAIPEWLRAAMVAAGQNPDEVAAKAAGLDLDAEFAEEQFRLRLAAEAAAIPREPKWYDDL
jgi:hypothetical protein